MPIRRKQQLQAVQESSEGVEPTFAGSDAVQVFDPAMTDDPDVQKRTPSGPTLSRGFSTIGRKNRQLTFKTDFRGSGDTSIPITEPDWAKFVRAAGYKTSSLRKLTMGAITGTGFQVGELVTQSSGALVGVVVGAFTSGGALTNRLTSTGGHLVIAPLAGAVFTAAATTGSSSGSTSTASAAAAYEGYGAQTTSEKLMVVTTGAWTSGTPAALYETLTVEDATTGVQLGAVQVVVDNSGPYTNMDVVLLWGAIANGNKLRTASGASTATLSADPVQTKTPSIAFRRNLDGRRKTLLGSRGDFTLEGEAGGPMQFSWTFSGDPGTDVDAAPVVTSGLSQITPPRLLGAFCCYGKGTELFRMPTKSVTLNNGGTVSPNLDANRAGGATGSNVTDRDPSISVKVDAVNGAFDWEAARDAGTPIRAVFLLGTTKGNIVGIVAPVCQVVEATESDAEGVATFDVTLEPRGVAESGDDDIYLVQL